MSTFKINPAHKGWCSPMSKSTCTGKRKQFAINAKNHFKKGDDGLTVPDDWTPGQPLSFSPQMQSSTDTIGTPYVEGKRIKPDIKDSILTGLTVLDRILPSQKIKMPVVRPQETYAQNPYGTGSEAMYADGGQLDDGTPRKVASVPKGYIPYPKLGPNYYHNPTQSAVALTPTKSAPGPKMSNSDWSAYVARKKASQTSSDDVVYIDPQTGTPTIPTVNPAFMNRGEQMFGTDNKAKGMSYYDIPQSSASGPVDKTANFGYYKPGSTQIDPNRTYKIPGDVWSNTMTGGTNFLRTDPESYVGEQAGNIKTTYDDGGTLSSDKAKEMLRDGTAHGRSLTKKQKQYFGMVASGKADNGASIQPIANSPQSGQTVQFNGPSHANGGIPIQYGGNNVEVEGGETGHVDPSGNLVIAGNMQAPGTNKKFKTVSKEIAGKEAKASKLKGKASSAEAKVADPNNKFDALTQNSADLMNKGADMKLKQLAEQKQHMALMQQAMLDTAKEHGIDPQEMSKGNIKKLKASDRKAMYGMTIQRYVNGGTVTKYPHGGSVSGGDPWDYRGTNTTNVDPKILGFVKLAQSKGLSGYSGAKSGYDKRTTSSGRPSRHSTGQAMDMMFKDPDTYQKILKDPELSGYLMKNGLTAINEYDPSIAKQTGATTGHIHIGYDKGTAVSDQFRKDASTMYPDQYKFKSGNYSPVKLTGNTGDAQTEQPVTPSVRTSVNNYVTPTPIPQTTTPQTATPSTRVVTTPFTIPKNPSIPSNKEGLDLRQVYPELYAAATNRTEPVNLQQYDPQLEQPYQVSFQDRINQNTSSFNAVKNLVDYNPEALSTIAGQKYAADEPVLADEFRTNDSTNRGIYNANINTLNDAQKTNLQLADQQYVRQSEARSKTKATDESILSSISDKYQQNKLEQRQLQASESMSGFRFDDSGNLTWMGGNAPLNLQGDAVADGDTSKYTTVPYTATKSTTKANGIPTVTTTRGQKVVKKADGGMISLYNQVYGKNRR